MRTLFTLIVAACIGSPTQAEIPRKEPLVKYTGLWTNSPFTSKPPVTSSLQAANPFEDYVLTGIAPVPGGHRVTIMSKKNPDLKKVIDPEGTGEFKIVSVNRNPEKTLGTQVVLSQGTIQGTVIFEPETITLKSATNSPTPAATPPGINPLGIPREVTTPNSPQAVKPDATQIRIPRPRIAPPPLPQAGQPSIPTPQPQTNQPPAGNR